MSRLVIDFGRRCCPRWGRTLRWTLAGVALLGLGTALDRYLTYRAATQAWHAAVAEQVVTTPQAAPPEEDAAKEKLAYATQLENTLTAPWENLFQIIETVPVPGVAMLEFATDTATRDIVLAAEARDIAAMHLYLEQVGAAPGLGGVHLAVHHVQPAGLSRSVRFSVNASWRALRAQAGVRTEGGT